MVTVALPVGLIVLIQQPGLVISSGGELPQHGLAVLRERLGTVKHNPRACFVRSRLAALEGRQFRMPSVRPICSVMRCPTIRATT